jgi:hypothetical protein
MRVHTASRKARSCVISTTLPGKPRSSSSSQAIESRSRWLVGSSSSSTSGTATSERASATRFFMPPDSSPMRRAPSRCSRASVVATRCSQFHASSASMRDCNASRSSPGACAS